VPKGIASGILSLGLSPGAILALVIVLYIFLGMFMESFTMVITTIPALAPVMFATGRDPVWFGIVFVVLLEMALITPPVGLNLYVIHGIRKSAGPMTDVIIGILPFFLCMLLLIGLLIAFPQIALWLPGTMFET